MDNLSTVSRTDRLQTRCPSFFDAPLPKSGMAQNLSKTEFSTVYRSRVKRFREEAEISQSFMARRLGLEKDRYSKYENRANSQLPPHLIEEFCFIVGCHPMDLLTYKLSTADKAVLRALRKLRRAG